MIDPLYTADEMRAAEAGHDVDELMARAGRAVAEEALEAATVKPDGVIDSIAALPDWLELRA